MGDDIYSGNSFSIEQVGGDWAIWRYCGHDGERERVILDTEGMDELRDYFAENYAEDRGMVLPATPGSQR